jgi:hypothetical protein
MASQDELAKQQETVRDIKNQIFKDFFDFNSEQNLKVRPPSEAYLYFPTGDELMVLDEKKQYKFQRKIFDNIEYTEFERKKLDEFSMFLRESEKENLLSKISVGNLLRFLQSSDYDPNKANISIEKHIEWLNQNLPIKVNSNIISILNSGFIYIHGRDHRFRPIIICSPKFFVADKYPFEDWQNAVIFILEYCINYLFIPGQVENWNLLVDLKDVSLYSVPGDLKNILTVVQENYKCRLNTMYVVNLGSFGNILWKIIKKILGESIERKLKMIKIFDELYEFIHIDQLEKKFGGKSQNTPVNFFPENLEEENFLFPPRALSNNYIPSEQMKNLLVSNEEYIEKIKSDPKIVKSPFLKDRMSVELLNGVPILQLDGEVFLTARENFTTEKNDTEEDCTHLEKCNNQNSEILQVEQQIKSINVPEVSLHQNKEKSEFVILRSEEMSLSSRRNQVIDDKINPTSNSPLIQKCKRALVTSHTKDEFSPILHAKSISTSCKLEHKGSIVTNNIKNKEFEYTNQVKVITTENNIQSTPGSFSNVPCFECEIKIEKETRRRGCGGMCGDSKSLCLIF